VSGSYTRGEPRQVTPEAGPRVAHGADAFITADFMVETNPTGT